MSELLCVASYLVVMLGLMASAICGAILSAGDRIAKAVEAREKRETAGPK